MSNSKSESNNSLWDKSYQSFDKDILIPGVKFPNEYLVNFIFNLNKSLDNATNKPIKILELGFGGLANMSMMAENNCTVEGLEVSTDAVERTNAAIIEFGLEDKLSVGLFKGGNIPKSDNTYDAIVGLQCCYYNLNQVKFAEECNRVLKPNGAMFLSFFSKNHGYMDYINEDRDTAGIVSFNNKHPNEKLRGLSLYLYPTTESFCKTYGRYFDFSLGFQNLNYAPIFSSWNYLTCVKSSNQSGILNKKPLPTRIDLLEKEDRSFRNSCKYDNKEISIASSLSKNDNYYNNYQKYPSEHVVRFLSTRNRRDRDSYFKKRFSLENNSFPGKGKVSVEIASQDVSNISAAVRFGYQVISVVANKKIIQNIDSELHNYSSVKLSLWSQDNLPVEDSLADVVFSSIFTSFYLNQEYFVKEVSRICKKGAEIFFMYISPRHGLIESLIKDNDFSLYDDNILIGNEGEPIVIYEKADLISLWSGDFKVDVFWIEDNMSDIFSSYYVVRGYKL
jgi:SAM-dependent methyltransferase